MDHDFGHLENFKALVDSDHFQQVEKVLSLSVHRVEIDGQERNEVPKEVSFQIVHTR